jgi:hypothetical protein
MMEFSDFANIVQTGGHTALMCCLWFLYQNWQNGKQSLEVLKAIQTQIESNTAQAAKTETRVNALHDEVIALPMNVLRVIRK